MRTRKKKTDDTLMKKVEDEEELIRTAFEDKNWAEIKGANSWMIFKVMVGKKFWKGLIDWFKKTLITEKMIHPEDMDLFVVVDTPEEAVKAIDDFYSKYLLSPNF